jgi:hypothetical protein
VSAAVAVCVDLHGGTTFEKRPHYPLSDGDEGCARSTSFRLDETMT